MAKREDIEDVIRMAVRVAARYAKEEKVILRWTLHYDPASAPLPLVTVTGNARRTKTVKRTSDRGEKR